MKVLVTGHDGYIGCALVPVLRSRGHDVLGLDSFLFAECRFGPDVAAIPAASKDVRAVRPRDLTGFDAVVHLAGISNDPLGDLRPETTDEINHVASVRLATMAKAVGIARFVFSSSCSLYGAHGEAPIDESAAFKPVTPYGRSKVQAEAGIGALADDHFTPTFLRNATAYGVSARLRGDLVVNNLVGFAVATGEVLLKSDGSPWRPLVHVDDIARAVAAVLAAPRETVHGEAFNVGVTSENYRIREVAEIVADLVPGSRVRFASGASPDKRNYRVNCDKIHDVLPGFRPEWTVPRGVAELRDAFVEHGMTVEQLTGPRFGRIQHVLQLMAEGLVGPDLRWRRPAVTTGVRHA